MVNKSALFILATMLMVSGCELKPPSSVAPNAVASGQGKEVNRAVAAASESVYLSGGQGAFSLSALKGQLVLLDFCAPWSAASKELVPELNRLAEEHHAAGLNVIGLVVDARGEDGLTPEVQALGAVYPLVAVPRDQVAHFGNVRSIPARLLFDRKGQLRQQYPGQVSAEQLRADIAVLLKE